MTTQSTIAPSQSTAASQENVEARLQTLEFNPIGVGQLRKALGEGPIYQRFKTRFDAADMAWFIAGAHKDGKHDLNRSRFHPQWAIGRRVQCADSNDAYWQRRRFRDSLKDLAWDAVSLGVVLVMNYSHLCRSRHLTALPAVQVSSSTVRVQSNLASALTYPSSSSMCTSRPMSSTRTLVSSGLLPLSCSSTLRLSAFPSHIGGGVRSEPPEW